MNTAAAHIDAARLYETPWISLPRSARVPSLAAAWLDTLDPMHLPDGRFDAAPGDIELGITALLAVAKTPPSGWQSWFAKDCAAMADGFAYQMGALRLCVRLDRIDDNGCCRIHADVATARMVCTYRGPSTCVVPIGHVSTATENPDTYDGPFVTPDRFEAAVLPGTLSASPALHRSPRIEGTGLVRLLLVVSPL
ncbi:DUF1826 domain-containing protein [Pyruvatibacter sp.]|uniref:DUF1826 domain-containing protein n=1 Tax=Pyruvatibacter sp. TaxID=1981328 RepID=UPI0032ECED69